MAMRRFRSRRGFTRKPRDLVWVTAIGGGPIAESTTTQSIMSAGTWEANSLNFERATLLRVRGYITMVQTAAASAAGTPLVAMALHIGPLTYTAGDFDPFVSSDYDATDVLWTWGAVCTNRASTQLDLNTTGTYVLDAKAKRRIDSSEQLLFTYGMAADAGATPSANIQFLMRCLINRA